MFDAGPPTQIPAPDQVSSVQGPPTYSTHLITLIRGLITYGQTLLGTLRTRNEPPETPASADLAMVFGTARIALIIGPGWLAFLVVAYYLLGYHKRSAEEVARLAQNAR